MSCDDEDCPGCIVEGTIRKLADMGMDPTMIIELMFSAMSEAFDVEFIAQQIQEAEEETRHTGTLH